MIFFFKNEQKVNKLNLLKIQTNININKIIINIYKNSKIIIFGVYLSLLNGKLGVVLKISGNYIDGYISDETSVNSGSFYNGLNPALTFLMRNLDCSDYK